jgi:ATP-dependent RNA helicase RhlB
MDFQRFGIDTRLAQAAEGLTTSFFFYEKMLALAVEKQENVCAKLSLDEGREEVILLPALQWLLSGENRKLLVATPDEASADRFAKAIVGLGKDANIEVCRVKHCDEDPPDPSSVEGKPSAAVLLGQFDELAASGVPLRDYGFLVIEGIDKIAERGGDAIRKFAAAVLPAWERRTILACEKLSAKAKTLAWDLADNPSELCIEGEAAKAESVRKETWSVPGESKMRFLLGLLSREKSPRICVFCNLRDNAEELAKRLEANGVASDYILGALSLDRKRAVLDKLRSGAYRCLVLTDQGAEGLDLGAFPLVVNFDIPLEPELFVKRLEMLDREADGAKLVSIACERYIYGLPAVESYIDARLEALPISEELLAVQDKSEGMSFGKHGRSEPRRAVAPRQDAARRDGDGRGRPRDSGHREDTRREDTHREDTRRDSRARGSYPREGYPREDRSPDIRKSISEATGGTLSMNSSSPIPKQAPAHAPTPRGPSGAESRSDSGSSRRTQGSPARKQASRGPSQRGNAQRPANGQRSINGPGNKQRGGIQQGNPYDTPIEERMKQYREKYGRNIGGTGRQGAPRPELRQPKPQQERPYPRQPQPKPQGSAQSKGLLDRLFGKFKKKSGHD